MEQYFATTFGDIRHERSVNLPLSLVEPNLLKQSEFTDHEIDSIKNLALKEMHRQRILKKNVALDLLEKHSSN